jgi:hypothetical protein
MTITRSIHLTMGNVPYINCKENQNTFYVQLFFFRKSCPVRDNVERYGTGQATDNSIIQRLRFACWIIKATNTHRWYVILIVFPLQQWLRERASILRYTHIKRLVNINTQYCWNRSQWPYGLRRGSAAARLLGLWFRIPQGHGCLLWVLCVVR